MSTREFHPSHHYYYYCYYYDDDHHHLLHDYHHHHLLIYLPNLHIREYLVLVPLWCLATRVTTRLDLNGWNGMAADNCTT